MTAHNGLAGLPRAALEAEVLRLRAAERGERGYSALVDGLDEGLCIIEFFDGPLGPLSDYLHIMANAGYERHTGISGIVGQTLRQIAPDEAEGWLEIYGGVLRTGKSVQFEREFVAAGRFIEVSASRIEPASLRQVSVLFRDISERRRKDAALRNHEKLLRQSVERVQLALAAGAIIGTWFWDLPLNRITVDEGFAVAFGLDADLGRDGLSFEQIIATVHPDDRAGQTAAVAEAVARGGAYAHQYRVLRADGRYYWIEANGRVDHDVDGVPLTFSGVLLDVEEKRALADERDRAAAELRALNDTLEQRVAERTAKLMQAEELLRQSQKMEAVGQLTGGVAHDFNNLLTVIRGAAELLRRPGLPEERRERYIDAIAETADRAAKLTGQLLAFARRQTLKPEIFDVHRNLEALREVIGTLVGSRIALRFEAPEEACWVNADASQFDTAIVNMAANARDAMHGAGALHLRIGISAELPAWPGGHAAAGSFVTVSVTDDGVGIPQENLTRIFEPFFTTKSVGQGTGLGLSQVFGFARQSGGDVRVISAPGQGSTFTLFLPRVPTPASEAVVCEERPPGVPSRGVRVLVVEDNPDVRSFATTALADLGYIVTQAENAAAALAVLEHAPRSIDVVFTDVVMPGMSGLDFARFVHGVYPNLPVVLASGYSHVLAAEGSSEFALLNKPYSIEQLSRALLDVLPQGAI